VPTKNHPTTALETILAHDFVRMTGEPVALVVGEDDRSAQSGLEAIRADYQPLEPVFDPQEALAEASPLLHSGGNLYEFGEVKKGDPQYRSDPADIVVDLSFTLATQDHVALEPESLVAYNDEKGCLVVIGPTHQPHARKMQIAQMLSLDPDHIRLIVPPMGGSFGGRHHFWPLMAIALSAHLTKQPVKLVYSCRSI
jgi:CO/xanthine dehydrogenase Mo-binding subunit